MKFEITEEEARKLFRWLSMAESYMFDRQMRSVGQNDHRELDAWIKEIDECSSLKYELYSQMKSIEES